MSSLSHRLLLASADPALHDEVKSLLRRIEPRFGLTWRKSPKGALRALGDTAFDLCFVDVTLGMELVRRAAAERPNVSLVLLHDGTEPDFEAEALRAGVGDCIPKAHLRPGVVGRVLRQIVRLREGVAGRQAAETALRDTEKLFRSILDHSPMPIFIRDRLGRYLMVNAEYQRLFARPLEQIVGRTAAEHLGDAELAAAALANDRCVIEGGTPSTFEEVIPIRGKPYTYLSTKFPLRNAAGEITGIGCIALDITERKAAQVALEESERRFRAMADSAPVLIWISGIDKLCTYFNRFWLEFTGRTQAQEMGDGWAEGVHSADRRRCLKTYCDAFDARRPFSMEYRLRRHDGVFRWIFDTGIPHFSPDGTFLGYIGSCVDISDQKQVEKRLEALSRSLETRVRERTRDLLDAKAILENEVAERRRLQESLLLEKKELETAQAALTGAYEELRATQARIIQQEKMASIGQLAAGVAHEINNPMGFISSNLATLAKYTRRLIDFIEVQGEALESAPLDEGARDALGELRRREKIDFICADIRELLTESAEGAERVKKIVQDLKTFSRKDEERMTVADLNETILSTLNMVRNEIKYKAALHTDFAPLPPVYCHPQQLSQVVMNLLVNAAQAIESDGEIRVRTAQVGPWVEIRVQDDGRGIAPHDQPRIFEPFFTTKEVGKGTGLGLSVSYDIVKKHDGELTFESAPGEGTTFTVRIPLRRAEDLCDPSGLTPPD